MLTEAATACTGRSHAPSSFLAAVTAVGLATLEVTLRARALEGARALRAVLTIAFGAALRSCRVAITPTLKAAVLSALNMAFTPPLRAPGCTATGMTTWVPTVPPASMAARVCS